MLPFETLDEIVTPEGRRLTLHRRGSDFFIHLDGEELMSTRRHQSEAALAALACRHLVGVRRPRVLIGGLGLGFTLRSALEHLPPAAEVVVAEVFPRVIVWHRTHLGDLGRPLEDPRVRVHEGDVRELLGGGRTWEAILLDVDNGPSACCLPENRGLYDRTGLAAIRRSLAPAGVLGVWSAGPDRAFVKQLGRSGFPANTETVRSHGRKGSRHTIFLARAPGSGGPPVGSG